MTVYQYIARTHSGEEVRGRVQADSETAAADLLSDQDLYPLRISLQPPARAGRRRGRVSQRDIGMMYGQLADLLASGVPLLRSMQILSRAARTKPLAELTDSLRQDVSAGVPLAEALRRRPEVFPPLHGAMIRAGEQAGFLETVLSNLSEFIERQDELRSRVMGATIYPVILTVLGAAATVGILLLLVPKFKPVFEGMPLPTPTVVMFALSDLLVLHWPILLAAGGAMVVGVLAYSKSRAGHLRWDRWRMRVPVFGRALRMVAVTRFCRILGTMLSNGVPILQALRISKDATGSPVLARSIAEAAEHVRAGQPLAPPLGTSGVFPTEILEMIAVAEESNQLEKVLVQTAETFERRTNRQVDQAVRLIEPLILVVIASVIGFVAVGLMFPIFKMAQTLR